LTDTDLKITRKQYDQFLKHYAWQLLQSPDYRLGQAFLNYFPEVGTQMLKDGKDGTIKEFKFFNERDENVALEEIRKWLEL
jgi:hypothetical protein